MILMIDNYDSFTYNVYQYIGYLYPQIQVVRNDEITVDEIKKLAPYLRDLLRTSGDRRSIWRKSCSSKRIDAWKNE